MNEIESVHRASKAGIELSDYNANALIAEMPCSEAITSFLQELGFFIIIIVPWHQN